MAKKLIMLRFDGEIWEIEPGYDTDENTVKCRVAVPKKLHSEGPHDQRAIDAGCTHVQTNYSGDFYHEVRRVR